MKSTKTDRRSQRTRQLLSAALLALMLEKRYDEITVQNIIDRANVGRATFYAHYFDKEDLLMSDFTRVLDSLSQHLAPPAQEGSRSPPSLIPFFRHVAEHHALYQALVRGGGIEQLYKRGQERLRENLEQHLRTLLPAGQPPAPLSLVAEYMAGAILTLLQWWLDHERPLSPEQMDALFQHLVLPGVQVTLQIPIMAGNGRDTHRAPTPGVALRTPHL